MKSHGLGESNIFEFESIGTDVIIEKGVRIFHPETIEIGDNVYIGHDTILHGHPYGIMTIGSNVWIGPQCYFHSAGNITIDSNVGIGPNVKMITSYHEYGKPIRNQPLIFKPILLEDGCDIGVGSIINPGVTIGKNTQIGSGSVVTRNIPDKVLAVGNPAKVVKNL
jgi:acetyltransferase-like isoleucine patch superfamily enzyme